MAARDEGYTKIVERGIRGWIQEEMFPLLPRGFFQNPTGSAERSGARVIHHSRLRWAGIFPLSDGRPIFLKRDKSKGRLELLKYILLPTKARREWFVARQLEKRRLPIPTPLGWMEKVCRGLVSESYYLSAAVGSGVSAFEEQGRLRDPSLIRVLADTVRRIHDSGLYHRDFHVGNFLLDHETFLLVDFHSARLLRSLSLCRRLRMVSHLFHSLRSTWGSAEETRFLDAYLEGEDLRTGKREDLLRRIRKGMDHLQRRQWRSRTKRCLKESSEFTVSRDGDMTYARRRDFSLDRIRNILDTHRRRVREEPASLLKLSPMVVVSMVDEGDRKVGIKQFCYPTLWDRSRENFRRSRGRKAWLASHGLAVRGIPALKAFALVERKKRFEYLESFFLMETFEGALELDRYLLKGFPGVRDKRRFVRTFAAWLSDLYRKGIYHRDMKTCNVLVVEEGKSWEFRLLDLEDVRLNQNVTERKLFRNLLQLNTSTPPLLTGTDRLRFFRDCLELNPIVRDRKKLLRRVIGESRKRGLVYVSPDGVVVERM